MSTVVRRINKRVRISYVGMYEDGTVFDACGPDDLLDVSIGRNSVFRPLDDALACMEAGEEREVRIPCEEAYGEYDPKGVVVLPRCRIQDGDKLEVGMSIKWHDPQKPHDVAVKVVEADAATVKLDFNHPLAGKDLVYRVKVEEVVARA